MEVINLSHSYRPINRALSGKVIGKSYIMHADHRAVTLTREDCSAEFTGTTHGRNPMHSTLLILRLILL